MPSLADAEVTSVLRKRVRVGSITAADGWRLLDTYRWMAVTRHNIFAMFDRIWELRANVTAYDAWYVALAESLRAELATLDVKLSRVTGPRCEFQTPPT